VYETLLHIHEQEGSEASLQEAAGVSQWAIDLYHHGGDDDEYMDVDIIMVVVVVVTTDCRGARIRAR